MRRARFRAEAQSSSARPCQHQHLPLPVERVRLLIGPEGGLSADEIAMTARYQFTDILLGPRVLRTETTALTAITALQVRFGDLG